MFPEYAAELAINCKAPDAGGTTGFVVCLNASRRERLYSGLQNRATIRGTSAPRRSLQLIYY